jgi:DNA-binding transcriptional LysR family regulator
MTLDQFKYFLETAKFQHIGKAALSLRISPSAVSTAVSALESELGTQLFERQGQGIRLTHQGQQFRQGVEKLLDQVGELRLSVGGSKESLSGNYRLAASHFLASRYLGPAWSELQSKYPQISAELNAMSTANVLSEILSGALDAGLCFSPLPHPDLRSVELYSGQLQIALRKNHPLLKKPPKEQLGHLSQYPAVIHKAIPGVEFCEDHPMFSQFGITAKTKCYWDSDDVAIEVMKKTDSWSMMPDIACRSHQSSIATLKPPAGWSAPYFIAFVFRSHRAENPFLGLLREEMQRLLK